MLPLQAPLRAPIPPPEKGDVKSGVVMDIPAVVVEPPVEDKFHWTRMIPTYIPAPGRQGIVVADNGSSCASIYNFLGADGSNTWPNLNGISSVNGVSGRSTSGVNGITTGSLGLSILKRHVSNIERLSGTTLPKLSNKSVVSSDILGLPVENCFLGTSLPESSVTNGIQEAQKPSFGNRARTGTRVRTFAFTLPNDDRDQFSGQNPGRTAVVVEPDSASRYGDKQDSLSQMKEDRLHGAGGAEEEEGSFDKPYFFNARGVLQSAQTKNEKESKNDEETTWVDKVDKQYAAYCRANPGTVVTLDQFHHAVSVGKSSAPHKAFLVTNLLMPGVEVPDIIDKDSDGDVDENKENVPPPELGRPRSFSSVVYPSRRPEEPSPEKVAERLSKLLEMIGEDVEELVQVTAPKTVQERALQEIVQKTVSERVQEIIQKPIQVTAPNTVQKRVQVADQSAIERGAKQSAKESANEDAKESEKQSAQEDAKKVALAQLNAAAPAFNPNQQTPSTQPTADLMTSLYTPFSMPPGVVYAPIPGFNYFPAGLPASIPGACPGAFPGTLPGALAGTLPGGSFPDALSGAYPGPLPGLPAQHGPGIPAQHGQQGQQAHQALLALQLQQLQQMQQAHPQANGPLVLANGGAANTNGGNQYVSESRVRYHRSPSAAMRYKQIVAQQMQQHRMGIPVARPLSKLRRAMRREKIFGKPDYAAGTYANKDSGATTNNKESLTTTNNKDKAAKQ